MRSDDTLLPAVTIEPAGGVDACVVWLHGLGADGHDFEPLVGELGLPPGHGVRFVFPHAPVMPVTINGGLRMRAWYDIVAADLSRRVDVAGIRASAARVGALLAPQRRQGVAAERLILAGFSQGGVVALHQGLRHEARLGGILALSCYLAEPGTLAEQRVAEPAPVMMMHGRYDEIVPLALAEQARRVLEASGIEVAWRVYPMAHSVCPDQVADIGAWLRQRLAL